MVKYRRRFEIIADILKVAGDGAKKTRIMYAANLSHALLEKYLVSMIDIGFIRVNNDGYEVTDKGQIFLERYTDFSSKYSKLRRELENLKFEREVLERMCAVQSEANSPRFRRGKK